MTRLLALGGVLVALAGAAPAGGKIGTLFALRYGAETNTLVPYDPVKLVPTGAPPIRTGAFGHAWSISPDRTRLVAAAGWRPTPGRVAAVRFVDLVAGRVEGTLTLPDELGRIVGTAWIRGRVLVVAAGPTTTVYSIDPNERKVIGRVTLPGVVVSGERAPKGLVLLLAPRDRIGEAILAVVDETPRLRALELSRISAGAVVSGEGPDRRTTIRRPGLALAPSGQRAYVLGAGEPAAAIDLRTLRVSYAPLRLPAAVRKNVQGAVRTASSLPDGRIVFSGFDYGVGAAGLWLVDPSGWSSRALDPKASWFAVGGRHVFARGAGGVGLRIVQPTGSVRELFSGRTVAHIEVVGPRALVTFDGTKQRAAVVELGSWRVISQSVPARPLVGTGQPIYG